MFAFMVAASKLLGIGLYSPFEAAMYARVSTQLMNRWVFGSTTRKRVISPQLDSENDRTVTFLDFVQTMAIRRIRQERNVPLEKIRQAYQVARDKFHVEYPFALDSTRIGLVGPPGDRSKQEVWISIGEDDDGAKRYFQLSGKQHGNQLIGEIVLTYASRLTFDNGGLAMLYRAFDTNDGTVVMDPSVRFGEPYLPSCGYTARTIYEAYRAEGSINRVTSIYGVDVKDVTLAIEYFDYLKPASAM